MEKILLFPNESIDFSFSTIFNLAILLEQLKTPITSPGDSPKIFLDIFLQKIKGIKAFLPDIGDQTILQSDWMRTFWPITCEAEFSQP